MIEFLGSNVDCVISTQSRCSLYSVLFFKFSNPSGDLSSTSRATVHMMIISEKYFIMHYVDQVGYNFSHLILAINCMPEDIKASDVER